MADDKFSPRREFRFSRFTRNHKSISSNILDAVAQFRGGEAAEAGPTPTRMRILVRKEDLKQVLEAIRSSDGRGCSAGRRVSIAPSAASSFEQRLNWMRRRQILRAASHARGRSRDSWRPVLQSIPEEM